ETHLSRDQSPPYGIPMDLWSYVLNKQPRSSETASEIERVGGRTERIGFVPGHVHHKPGEFQLTLGVVFPETRHGHVNLSADGPAFVISGVGLFHRVHVADGIVEFGVVVETRTELFFDVVPIIWGENQVGAV